MIQSIYSSVSNADSVSCGKKGTIIKSDPIPLLRDKFLGEYRTELEKAKVRKNLGIPDENVLSWGNIEGFVEKQTDLVEYVESKWHYETPLDENIKNIQEAMDYALKFVTNFVGEGEAIASIQGDIVKINNSLTGLQTDISENSNNIGKINNTIIEINNAINQLNSDLDNINVDANISAWVEKTLSNSKSLEIKDEKLEVVISNQSNNALRILEHQEAVKEDIENGIEAVEEILPGLYVKDLTKDIEDLTEDINGSLSEIEILKKQHEAYNADILKINEELDVIDKYNSELPDNTEVPIQVGGIKKGTTVVSLKDKTINQIIDTILFPRVVKTPINPQLSFKNFNIPDIISIGSPTHDISTPTNYLNFNQNDAGNAKEYSLKLLYNGEEFNDTTYSKLGNYTYNGTVSYEQGPYMTDNTGAEDLNTYIESGELNVTKTIYATYPWYINNEPSKLLKFDTQSEFIEFILNGESQIAIPGNNSTFEFEIFGLSWGEVNLNAWEQTTKDFNGISYKVLRKKEPYNQDVKHRIRLKLML